MRQTKISRRVFPVILAVWLATLAFSNDARANVYASNIKLNGALSSVTNASGGSVTISYILNEPATLGTTISIISGTNVVDTIGLASGNTGTLKGTNSVVWGGTNSAGGNAPGGTYAVAITPAAQGYTNWTQTSTDTNAGYHVYSPRGIAVDTSTNSLYYGRVFLANAATGPNSAMVAGDVDGIIKVNADGSLADEGQGNAGYDWVDDDFNDSPHFLRYGTDDRIYGLDWTGSGVVIGCDVLMTTNSQVFGNVNWQNNPFASTINNGFGWSCFDVVRPETTNGWVFMGDNDNNGAGYWGWPLINGNASPTNTVGTQLVAVGGELSIADGGLMMDVNSNVYVAEYEPTSGNTNNRVMLFTNWNGATPFTNGAVWTAGSNDNNFRGNYDMALDSRVSPKYVGLALASSGGIRVLYATNGLVVSNASSGQVLTNLDYPNLYYGVSWDAAGNLYGASSTLELWRVFSPPGTNQATTVAVETITVNAPIVVPPTITSISVSGGVVTINFTGSASEPASAFTVLGSPTAGPASGYTAVSAATIVAVSPGVFRATFASGGLNLFYRIIQGSAAPVAPTITSINVSGGMVTVNFTGSTNDPASAFTLLRSGMDIPASAYAAAGASNTLVSPGVFQSMVATNGFNQFYRIKR